jgi:hypothetical protein
MALSFDVSPADREIIDEIAERANRGASVSAVIAGLDPAIHLFARILMRRRWTRGSSPRVTIGGRIKVTGTRSLVHANANPLRLAEFRDAGAYDFAHQIIRTRANLNRENGKLENGFKPLFSAGEGA